MSNRGWALVLFGLILIPVADSWAQEKTAGSFAVCAPDIDAAIREIQLDRLEDWDFTAPIRKHGATGKAYLAKVILLESKRSPAATFLLAHLRDKDLLWLLTSLAMDRDAKVRWRAMEGIRLLKATAQPAIPFLEELATKKEWQGANEKWLIEDTLATIRKSGKKKALGDK